jgi:hypothetical protein
MCSATLGNNIQKGIQIFMKGGFDGLKIV